MRHISVFGAAKTERPHSQTETQKAFNDLWGDKKDQKKPTFDTSTVHNVTGDRNELHLTKALKAITIMMCIMKMYANSYSLHTDRFQMKPPNKHRPNSEIPMHLYFLPLNWDLDNCLVENERLWASYFLHYY